MKFKDVGTGFNCLDIAIENGHKSVQCSHVGVDCMLEDTGR